LNGFNVVVIVARDGEDTETTGVDVKLLLTAGVAIAVIIPFVIVLVVVV